MYDRTQFFSGYRAAWGSLSQQQVDGLEFLLSKLEQDTFSLKQASYILATVDHETAHTFQPIKERRARTGTAVRKLQDKYWGSGYYGRGYCQITWKENYQKFGIADNPDAALEPETAYRILSEGMKRGMFTGKKLSDFVNGQADYFNARKVVNRLDKAGEIADRARKYESFLVEVKPAEASTPAGEEVKPTATVTVKAEEPTPTDPTEQGVVKGIKSHVAAAVGFLSAGGSGVIAWVQGASTPLIIGFFGAAAVIGLAYIVSRTWFRNKENERVANVQMERERRAHELTVLKMQSAMNSKALTVEVSHPEKA